MKPSKINYGALGSLAVGLAAVLVFGLLLAQGTQNSASTGVNPVPLLTPVPSPPAVEAPLATVTELPTLPATETSQPQATPTPLETEADIGAILTQKWIVYATWEQYLTANPIGPGTRPTGILEGGGADFYYPNHDVIRVYSEQGFHVQKRLIL
jgi:hypothetical protein